MVQKDGINTGQILDFLRQDLPNRAKCIYNSNFFLSLQCDQKQPKTAFTMLGITTHLKGDLYAQILEAQAEELRSKILPDQFIEEIWRDLKPNVPQNMRMICTRGYIYSTKALITTGTSIENGKTYNLFLIYRVSFHLH